ncbi:MAG: ABC transporter permease [Bryobacterales bacterium]|nr:ABC transporter permease [Bryobacterales bacterium]
MMQRLLPFFTLITLFVGLSVASPHFLTTANLGSVIRQTAVLNIMALGMTMIIIAGGIDLSVGAILALSGLLGCMLMTSGYPIWMGLCGGVLVGAGCGLANGLMTAKLRINPFIVTLGTLGIYRGIALILSGGLGVHSLPKGFSYLGEGSVLGIPFVLLVLLVCGAAVHVLLEHTFTQAFRWRFIPARSTRPGVCWLAWRG